jgi:lipopolysaccharide transport system ATP-binding protein
MEGYLEDGGTLLLCSHSMYHIQKLCRNALWLKDGRVRESGTAADVAQAYLAYHEEKTAGQRQPVPRAVASAAGVYAIQSLEVLPDERFVQGNTLAVRAEVYSPDGRVPVVLIGIVRAEGTPVYGVATDMDRVQPRRIDAHRFAVAIDFPRMALLPGKYVVRAHALDPEGVRLFDHVERAFTVGGDSRELGLVRLEHRWIDAVDERSAPDAGASAGA